MEWMSLVRPTITVVDQPVHELGRQAAERLLARIGGDASPPRQVRLEAALLVRHSCAAPQTHVTA
jgi:LacI family transcriptional regulator